MMKYLMFLLSVLLMPISLLADPCPDDVTPPVITSKGSTWDCTFDIFHDSDTNFIEVTEESTCGLKEIGIADWDMVRGSCSDPFVKQYTVIWYAEDVAGNSTNFTQEITIERPQVSDIVFPSDTMVQCPVSGYENPELFGYPTINGRDMSDKCGFRIKYNLLDTIKSMDSDRCLTEVRKEWTAIENCSGQTIKDTQYIVLIDTIRPIIACSALDASTRLLIDEVSCFAIYNFPEADAVDFCAADEDLVFRYRIDSTITGKQVALRVGTYEGSIIVTDPCMNADTCYYEIEVVDESAPLFTCPPDTPVVMLTSPSQEVTVTDLGLSAIDCSGPVEVLYRLASQNEGEEGNAQTFTCDMVNSTVNIVVLARDSLGNESEPDTCSVNVTEDGNVCPALRSAFYRAGMENTNGVEQEKEMKAYYNGQDIILNSEERVTALRLYSISGTIMWEKTWMQGKHIYQGSLPGNVNGGIYILKIEKISKQEEIIKLAIF